MFESLPGFRDFYPEECAQRNFLFRRWEQTARRFGFLQYDIPTLEPLELFTEKSGEEIVTQLFNFTDKGGREVALRPELTPSLARMVGAKASSLRRPIKWFNIAENFRYEKPQKGRLRSHYQFNGDVYGEPGPGADAEVMALCLACMQSCGLGPQDIVLRLSDRNLWLDYLACLGKAGADALAVLAVVDKMERMEPADVVKKLEPQFGEAAGDFLAQIQMLTSLRSLEDLRRFLLERATDAAIRARLEERLAVWHELLGRLGAFGLMPFIRIDLGIVRGLAYYTGFVFEVFELDGGGTTGRALAGGGRYDHLVKKLGYNDLPAVGFGMGDVTMTDLIRGKGLFPTVVHTPDLYTIIGGEAERAVALEDVASLRTHGYAVEYPLKEQAFGKQFKAADASGARVALVYGSEELAAGTVKIRDLKARTEQAYPRAQLLDAVRQLFEGGA